MVEPDPITEPARPPSRLRSIILALIPLAVIAAMVWLFVAKGSDITAPIRQDANLPLAESITFERVVFKKSQIIATVRNSGPEDITIAAVHINDMATRAYISPSNTIPRMKTATVTVPTDWVEGEPHEVRLVSSTGIFHATMVDVAAMTPVANARFFAVFALLGIYVGVIPVLVGLIWFPFMRTLNAGAMDFFLTFTIGLLVFLGFDALEEAFELQHKVAAPLQPGMLILMTTVAAFLLLSWVSKKLERRGEAKGTGFRGVMLAYMIAFGIGIHNFGEGLAIGAAYTVGEVALGGMLVLGFMIHNTTEGIAIVAPVSKSGARLSQLVVMGLVGGIPTIVGAWLGGFAYTAMWSLVALGIGAGAIFQVVYVIGKSMMADRPGAFSRSSAVAGLLGGFAVMYLTGLLVS